MCVDKKRRLVDHYRRSLDVAGLALADPNAILRPLCWQETAYDDLTLEHIVPQAVGGSTTTLACKECNNTHGSELDSHLSAFQNTQNFFKGQVPLKARMGIEEHEVAVNLTWGDTNKKMDIVDRASNPSDVEAMEQHIEERSVDQIRLHFCYGYALAPFRRGRFAEYLRRLMPASPFKG